MSYSQRGADPVESVEYETMHSHGAGVHERPVATHSCKPDADPRRPAIHSQRPAISSDQSAVPSHKPAVRLGRKSVSSDQPVATHSHRLAIHSHRIGVDSEQPTTHSQGTAVDSERPAAIHSQTTAIPSDQPAAIFDPHQFRLIEPPLRIKDLEKALHFSDPEKPLPASKHSTTSSLSSITSLSKPPPPHLPSPLTLRLRHGIFAVYQRLFTFVLLLNVLTVLILLHTTHWNARSALQPATLATLASANLLLAILFRQDWLVNLLFRTAWRVPWCFPLSVRKVVGRVYCYGGIHSGAAVAGTGWWVCFTAGVAWEGIAEGKYTPGLLVLALVIAALLVTISVLSIPGVRRRWHDAWEGTHRFLGWAAVGLFWVQIVLLTRYAADTSSESESESEAKEFWYLLLRTPSFWCLTLITALLIYPWLLLRRWTFTATPLSDHALQLSFDHPVHKYSCLALSSSPLREWHPFATFPLINHNGAKEGNSLIISAAGDWTRGLISTAQKQVHQSTQTDKDPTIKSVQMHLWIKSHPHPGVLSLSCIYPSILLVTTGSGIGPCLSSLLHRPASQHARLIWFARSPLQTFGAEMMELVRRADGEAVVWDTAERGRLGVEGMVGLVEREWKKGGLEAVFVLSNEGVTRGVLGGLVGRGITAFGPVWDS